jgi:hypothetical protein
MASSADMLRLSAIVCNAEGGGCIRLVSTSNTAQSICLLAANETASERCISLQATLHKHAPSMIGPGMRTETDMNRERQLGLCTASIWRVSIGLQKAQIGSSVHTVCQVWGIPCSCSLHFSRHRVHFQHSANSSCRCHSDHIGKLDARSGRFQKFKCLPHCHQPSQLEAGAGGQCLVPLTACLLSATAGNALKQPQLKQVRQYGLPELVRVRQQR